VLAITIEAARAIVFLVADSTMLEDNPNDYLIVYKKKPTPRRARVY